MTEEHAPVGRKRLTLGRAVLWALLLLAVGTATYWVVFILLGSRLG